MLIQIFVLSVLVVQASPSVRDAAAIRVAKSAIVRSMESSLPATPFEAWLRETTRVNGPLKWEVNDCGEQTGNPKVDQGRDFPMCAEVEVPLSGQRTLSVSIVVGRLQAGVGGKPGFWSAYIKAGDGSVRWIKKLAAIPSVIHRRL